VLNALRIEPGASVSSAVPVVLPVGTTSTAPVLVGTLDPPRYNRETNPVERRKQTSTNMIATFLKVDARCMDHVIDKYVDLLVICLIFAKVYGRNQKFWHKKNHPHG